MVILRTIPHDPAPRGVGFFFLSRLDIRGDTCIVSFMDMHPALRCDDLADLADDPWAGLTADPEESSFQNRVRRADENLGRVYAPTTWDVRTPSDVHSDIAGVVLAMTAYNVMLRNHFLGGAR